MSSFKCAFVVIVFLNVSGFAQASEPDEIRVKVEAMQREAVKLAKHAHNENAHSEHAANLKRQAKAMMVEAERLEQHQSDQPHPAIMKLTQRLEQLRGQEKELAESAGEGERLDKVRLAIKQTEVELQQLSQQPERQHHSQDELPGRLEHMRKAVEHLKHAGLQDVAAHVAQRVAAAEREMHEHPRPHDGDVIHEVMKQLETMRNEVKQLRDEVSDLKKDRK